MNPAGVAIVLIEPKGAANIGSVCRAMRNFGFSDLRLVKPRTDHLSGEARNMAVKAEEVLEAATVHDDLAAAVADCRLVIGTTRRFGKYREEFLHPDEAGRMVAQLPGGSRAALVFGREDKGLSTAELDYCQRFLTIPVTEDHPSMNLAQAVCLCLYETARSLAAVPETTPGSGEPPAASLDLEEMYGHMERTLLEIGFLNPQNPTHLMRAFRRMLNRQGLTGREVRIVRGMLSRVDWLESERKRLVGE